MCALFAAVGGPLDYMFSGIIDNRMRHKTASNVIIEDDGICGDVAGHKICAGSEDYMRRNGIAIPQAAMSKDAKTIDTIKVMYSAEDGEVNAKFYIRYSFSEEFTSTIPSLRDSGIIPLVYTRDPNVSDELLSTLNAGNCTMRVVKLYDPANDVSVKARDSARMVTYGDRLDAASMIILAKKYNKFSAYLRFAEICAMILGVALAIALAYIARINFKAIPMAALWQIVLCAVIKLLSNNVFLNDSRKKSEGNN
jgi:VIT1/CCC1 family predicted Fe2+/Mn2+ transporter